MRIKYIKYIILFFAILVSCDTDSTLKTPEQISDLKRTRILSNVEAIKAIDKLHGLAVAADNNTIAEYGQNDPKDLLYVSYYQQADSARQIFNRMLKKMSAAKNSPFYHLKPLPGYHSDLYFTMGMGAYHYIFISGHYVLWYQTYRTVGMELPPAIASLYPVAPSVEAD